MKDRWQIEAELLREYITPELRQLALVDMDAMRDLIVKEMLAEIDSNTLYWAQFEDGNGPS